MEHVIKPEYVDEDGRLISSVVVEAPDVIWLQVANYDNPHEASPREDWTFHDEPVMENDVAYVPLYRAETAEKERDELRIQVSKLSSQAWHSYVRPGY
jgi:hypothetical protein